MKKPKINYMDFFYNNNDKYCIKLKIKDEGAYLILDCEKLKSLFVYSDKDITEEELLKIME